MKEWLLEWALEENLKGNLNIEIVENVIKLRHKNGKGYNLITNKDTVETFKSNLNIK